ncbi:MAG: hypothetical protein ACREFO_14140, partial [Acetobacteraceae bacterium]
MKIAGLQGGGQMDNHADFERAPVEGDRIGPELHDKALPALGGKSKIDRVQHLITAGAASASLPGAARLLPLRLPSSTIPPSKAPRVISVVYRRSPSVSSHSRARS